MKSLVMLVETTNVLGGVTRQAYDAQDRLATIARCGGIEHRMRYDNLGRRIESIDAEGHVSEVENTSFASGAALSRPIKTKAVSAQWRAYAASCDAQSRLVARTSAAVSAINGTTRIAYDAGRRLISMTNPAGRTIRFMYDPRRRRVETVSPRNHLRLR